MKKNSNEVVKLETLKVKVTSETLSDLISLIKEKGWQTEEGLRIILGAGYGYFLGNPNIKDNKQGGKPKSPEQLIEQLIKAEAKLGSLRFRAYEIQQANTNWELSTGAIHRENTGLRNIAKRRLEEVDDLQTRVAKLKEENTELKNKIKDFGEINIQQKTSKRPFLKLFAKR